MVNKYIVSRIHKITKISGELAIRIKKGDVSGNGMIKTMLREGYDPPISRSLEAV